MWISRSDFDRLVRRVEKLEEDNVIVSDSRYQHDFNWFTFKYRHNVKSVVKLLLAHLDLKLETVTQDNYAKLTPLTQKKAK